MTDILTENNSGGGKDIVVPNIVSDKFNWGAFLLTWIWGLGHKSYITLISLAIWALNVEALFVGALSHFRSISGILGLGVAIWFGIKGNEWAWRNNRYESVEVFHSCQKKWTIAGIIVHVLFLFFGFAIVGLILNAALKSMGS